MADVLSCEGIDLDDLDDLDDDQITVDNIDTVDTAIVDQVISDEKNDALSESTTDVVDILTYEGVDLDECVDTVDTPQPEAGSHEGVDGSSHCIPQEVEGNIYASYSIMLSLHFCPFTGCRMFSLPPLILAYSIESAEVYCQPLCYCGQIAP